MTRPYYQDDLVTLWHANALALPLPDDSVDLVCTSPPYFNMRGYTDAGEAYGGQIGGEKTPAEFVAALIDATREMVRVLKPDGNIWINLGDTYVRKSLLLVPERYRIAAADELGLIVRAVAIWSKPGKFIDAKARGRVRRSHEDWVHLSLSRDPFQSTDAISERPAADYRERPQYRRAIELFEQAGLTEDHRRAVRAVGVIDSAGGAVRSGGRFSSTNGRLAAEVKAALGSYYREFCGSSDSPKGQVPGSVWEVAAYPLKFPPEVAIGHHSSFPITWPDKIIRGWCPPDGTVLDPFGGTGTTALAAVALGRPVHYVDLSRDYCRLAEWRLTRQMQAVS